MTTRARRRSRSRARTTRCTHGDVVIAAITSCTNTSNPSVMLGAGLLARKARERGLKPKPYVKTSLAPGSRVVTDYLEATGLMDDLEALGFDLVGYGCTTCIGNSGPLPEPVAKAVDEGNLVVAAVLSGNRNFEGRIHPQVKASYLASPPLVVAYALAGSLRKDLVHEPLGQDQAGNDVFLKDIWPWPAGSGAAGRARRVGSHVPRGLCRRVQGRRALGRGSAALPAGPTPGTTPAPTSACRRTSSAWTGSRPRPPTSRARASWRCSAIRSPPTTSRPRARSPRTARPAAT